MTNIELQAYEAMKALARHAGRIAAALETIARDCGTCQTPRAASEVVEGALMSSACPSTQGDLCHEE